MSSNITKIIITLSLLIGFTGCLKKDYNTYSYKTSAKYKKIKNQKIRNSKNMHRATMRSYVIAGKKYYPEMTTIGATFSGIASWYGPNFHAKKTSNGETYDMFAQTAASKTLPMNTMVKVYNKENGKSTIVRINDRGPFVTGRIIDLSNKAAHAIDMVKKGTAQVEIEIIGFNAQISNNKRNKKMNNDLAVEEKVFKDVVAKDVMQSKAKTINTGNYYLQIGVFSNINGAKKIRDDFNKGNDSAYKAKIIQVRKAAKILNKVFVMAFKNKDEAKLYKNEYGLQNAMIVAK